MQNQSQTYTGITADHGAFQIFGNSGSITNNIHYAAPAAATNELYSSFKANPVFIVSFERDPDFISRDAIKAEIDQALSKRQRVALSGIGGIGKSQLAIDYCYRFAEINPEGNVFWIHSSSSARFSQAYTECATSHAIPGWNDPSADVLKLVASEINRDERRWLLVLDNADDRGVFFGDTATPSPELRHGLAKYIPQSSYVQVLITTRDARLGRDLARGVNSIAVSPLLQNEAVAMLLAKLPMEHDELETVKLAAAMEYLPLAVTQAAAFISENNISISKYLAIYNAHETEVKELLSAEHYDSRRDEEKFSSVFRTWKLSFDQIAKQHPRAAELLSLMAMLDRQSIPDVLLRREGEKETEFITTIGTLQAFSLVSTLKQGSTYEMHRLVQLSVQKWLEINEFVSTYQERALHSVARAFPLGKFENWTVCEALLPHAQRVLDDRLASTSSISDCPDLLLNLGIFYESKGEYEQARGILSGLVTMFETSSDSNQHEKYMVIDLLALVLLRQGKYAESETLARQACEGLNRLRSPGDVAALNSLNHLAMALVKQSKFEEAQTLHRQAFKGFEALLGMNDDRTLACLSDLSWVLLRLGRFAEAVETGRAALDGYIKVMGPEHPLTFEGMNNLALALVRQGMYQEAEEYLRQALKGFEGSLGEKHLRTLATMTNICALFPDLSKFEETEELNRRALAGFEDTLGCDHPDTLNCQGSLAVILLERGKFAESEQLSRQVLKGRMETLGEEHADTLVTLMNLASNLSRQGRLEAASLYRQALGSHIRVLGIDHPDTLRCMHHLAVVLGDQGHYVESEALSQRVIEGRQRVLGPDHLDTLDSRRDLAILIVKQGKNGAEKLLRELLDCFQRIYGDNHLKTLACDGDMADLLSIERRYEEAEAFSKRAMNGRMKALGQRHPKTIESMIQLAGVYTHRHKHFEAEELRVKVLECQRENLGANDAATISAMRYLSYAYMRVKKVDEALSLLREAIEVSENALGTEHPETLSLKDDLHTWVDSLGSRARS